MVSPGSAHIAYAYSPSNQRVWKGTYNVDQFFVWTLASQEVYFYGVDGKRLGTYSVALPNNMVATELFVYFGQKMIGKSFSSSQPTTFVPFVGNRLGSNGDYYPYGQDKGTPLPNDEVKFATYTRDSATSLDYAMNRYYANSLGRFSSPDQFRGKVTTPQSWNRYGYAAGDPVNGVDPIGRFDCSPEEPDCRDPCDDDPELCDPGPGPQPDPSPTSRLQCYPFPLFNSTSAAPKLQIQYVPGQKPFAYYGAPITLFWSAFGGTGNYMFTVVQTIESVGTATYTNGTINLTHPLVLDRQFPGQVNQTGSFVSFKDAPGIALHNGEASLVSGTESFFAYTSAFVSDGTDWVPSGTYVWTATVSVTVPKPGYVLLSGGSAIVEVINP